jgi:ABC-type sulfate transport system permease component
LGFTSLVLCIVVQLPFVIIFVHINEKEKKEQVGSFPAVFSKKYIWGSLFVTLKLHG